MNQTKQDILLANIRRLEAQLALLKAESEKRISELTSRNEMLMKRGELLDSCINQMDLELKTAKRVNYWRHQVIEKLEPEAGK